MENTDPIEQELKDIQDRAAKVRSLNLSSSGPYFNEKGAEFAKKVIEQVTSTKSPFTVTAKHISINTLRQKYFQGCKYLRRHDPEMSKLIETVECQKLSDSLVFVFKPKQFILRQLTVDWKEKFQTYIDTAVEHQIFNHPEYAKTLTEQEKAWCVLQLEQIGNRFIWIINDEMFKIIKEQQE